jgi:hypothetical protein
MAFFIVTAMKPSNLTNFSLNVEVVLHSKSSLECVLILIDDEFQNSTEFLVSEIHMWFTSIEMYAVFVYESSFMVNDFFQ